MIEADGLIESSLQVEILNQQRNDPCIPLTAQIVHQFKCTLHGLAVISVELLQHLNLLIIRKLFSIALRETFGG